MDADQLAETTMDPLHRTLRRVTAEDAQQAALTFELLMAMTSHPGAISSWRARRLTGSASTPERPAGRGHGHTANPQRAGMTWDTFGQAARGWLGPVTSGGPREPGRSD